MGRPPRVDLGNYAYHVLNRSNAGVRIFRRDSDYEAFEHVLCEAVERTKMRLLCYCIMPNHWHLVLWPREDGDLGRVMQWLTLTHTQRWHAHHGTSGRGHLYQGRYKSFPIAMDDHFYQVCRYVERNALRAGLVSRAEDWRWGSAWIRVRGSPEQRNLLSDWPTPVPPKWTSILNRLPQPPELVAIRTAVRRGSPFGTEAWKSATAARFGLVQTIRPPGRPKKGT